jgi:nicotinamide riboside transporter PnuC
MIWGLLVNQGEVTIWGHNTQASETGVLGRINAWHYFYFPFQISHAGDHLTCVCS